MPYPFQEYVRHEEAWKNARSLERVLPKPEEVKDGWINIGKNQSFEAVQPRIMHMLSGMGYGPKLRKYYGLRFFFVNRFIGENMDRLTREWLVTVNDGRVAAITNACRKAVLEAFEPEPMPNPAGIDIEKIVKRGKELLETGFSEPLV